MNVTKTSFIFPNKCTNDDYIRFCESQGKFIRKVDIDVPSNVSVKCYLVLENRFKPTLYDKFYHK